jgi:hypothetical protein
LDYELVVGNRDEAGGLDRGEEVRAGCDHDLVTCRSKGHGHRQYGVKVPVGRNAGKSDAHSARVGDPGWRRCAVQHSLLPLDVLLHILRPRTAQKS